MKLTIMSYNTLFGGRDGADDRRAAAQIALLNARQPDIFLMQEAKGLDADGGAWLYQMEAQTGMRGFLVTAPTTGQHVAVFIRAPLQPIAFLSDSTHFHHALATLKVALPGGSTLTLMSAHLCPNGPAVRRREASYLAVQAAADAFILLTGDFNSASPHDPEPADFDALPAHHRARYLAEDGRSADRSVLAQLEAAGWVDIGFALGGAGVPTVPTAGFSGTEFASMRCDYVLASKTLADCARSYEVIRTPATDWASDHYPVLAAFDLSQ